MDTTTRDDLLGAARALLEEGGVADVTMVAVAKRAGVSRQAAYLHFDDRGDLLVALIDRIDREHDLDAEIERLRAAPTPAAKIRAWAEMQVRRNPRVAPLARALDAVRHDDTASAQAWRAKVRTRLGFARDVVDELARAGDLHRGWDRDAAAALLCELTSIRVWDDLVNDLGLAPDVYVQVVTTTAAAAFAAAPTRRRAVVAP